MTDFVMLANELEFLKFENAARLPHSGGLTVKVLLRRRTARSWHEQV